MWKIKVKVPENLRIELWENSSYYQIDWFFYNKIFDERDFWNIDLGIWSLPFLNEEKLILYKEILKREYVDKLQDVFYYDRYFRTKKFKDFLKIKNELKYILDIFLSIWEIETFYFWYDFKDNEWDKNDTFWKKLKNKESIFIKETLYQWEDEKNLNSKKWDLRVILEKNWISEEKFLSLIKNKLNTFSWYKNGVTVENINIWVTFLESFNKYIWFGFEQIVSNLAKEINNKFDLLLEDFSFLEEFKLYSFLNLLYHLLSYGFLVDKTEQFLLKEIERKWLDLPDLIYFKLLEKLIDIKWKEIWEKIWNKIKHDLFKLDYTFPYDRKLSIVWKLIMSGLAEEIWNSLKKYKNESKNNLLFIQLLPYFLKDNKLKNKAWENIKSKIDLENQDPSIIVFWLGVLEEALENEKFIKDIKIITYPKIDKWFKGEDPIVVEAWLLFLTKLGKYDLEKVWNSVKNNLEDILSALGLSSFHFTKLLKYLIKNGTVRNEVWDKINDFVNKNKIKKDLVFELFSVFAEFSEYGDKIFDKLSLYKDKSFDNYSFISLLTKLGEYKNLKRKIWNEVEDILDQNLIDNKDSLWAYWNNLLLKLISEKDIRLKVMSKFSWNIKNSKIENFLTFKSGSFLLTGYRGVGKTTLLKQLIKKYNQDKQNKEKIIPVFVNVPEPINKDWKKEFNKKQLMDFIIRNLYFQIQKYKKDLPKDFLQEIEDQYIRTFKNIKDYEFSLIVKKNFTYRAILAILKYSIPFVFTLLAWIATNYFSNYLSPISKSLFNAFLGVDFIKVLIAWIVFLLSSKMWFSIVNIKWKASYIESLYDENIAEQRLVDSFKKYQQGIKKNLTNILEYLNKLNLAKFLTDILGLIVAVFTYSLVKIKWLINFIVYNAHYLWYFALFLSFVFVTLKYWFNLYVSLIWFILAIFVVAKFFISSKQKYKFVIVIDELDKLLDFDKMTHNKDRWKLDMAQIFDILWKLKVLFFDTKWVLFFAVANKDAYDYYLKNKNKEDDLISNIFNQITYLPMNKKEKFNLNYVFLKDISVWELFILNTWLYFKSHGNWRKAKFILNDKLDLNILEIDIDKEDKYAYDFFLDLYEMLKKWSLNNFKNTTSLYKHFITEQNIIKTYETFKNNSDYKEFNKLTGLDDFLKKVNKFAYIKWFVASIEKISSEPAFRDYILNSLLNLYEVFKEGKLLKVQETFDKIWLRKDDFEKNLVYDDLIRYYLPFMIYILTKEDENSWNTGR